MTPVQYRAYQFILAYINQHGYSPTLGEIGAGLGVSQTRAFYIVQALHERGYIHKVPGAQRGIRILEEVA